MADDKMPQDPLAGFGEFAVSMHELYESYVKAGFTADQALYITVKIFVAMLPKSTPGEEAE